MTHKVTRNFRDSAQIQGALQIEFGPQVIDLHRKQARDERQGTHRNEVLATSLDPGDSG